jgi:GT2 family glycosyltransferase
VGLFWEKLFFAREEDDLALRLLDAGYDIIYLPSVVLRHKVSPAARTHAGDKLRLDLRNTLWIAWKYLPAIHALRISLARSTLYSVRSFRIGQPSAALLGFAEALKELRAILSERRPLAQETYHRYVRLNPKMRWLPRRSSEPVYIDSRRPTAR